jgi:hypothetical protein
MVCAVPCSSMQGLEWTVCIFVSYSFRNVLTFRFAILKDLHLLMCKCNVQSMILCS